jgi:hypothetical protein
MSEVPDHVALADTGSGNRTMRTLERIADELALIRAELSARGAEAEVMRPDVTMDSSYPEVSCSTARQYSVGSFHYTVLQHAIAQAKRARRDAALAATVSGVVQ